MAGKKKLSTVERARQYIDTWKARGYPEDIPDEVPHELRKLGVAPSYKAIALALLTNDMNLESLGFTAPVSKWYSAFKRVEIEQRKANK